MNDTAASPVMLPPADTLPGTRFYVGTPSIDPWIMTWNSPNHPGVWMMEYMPGQMDRTFTPEYAGAAGWRVITPVPSWGVLASGYSAVQGLHEALNAKVEEIRSLSQRLNAMDTKLNGIVTSLALVQEDARRRITEAQFAQSREYTRSATMRRMLSECRRVFLLYEAMHRAKPDAEKADRNLALAERCQEALRGEGTTKLEELVDDFRADMAGISIAIISMKPGDDPRAVLARVHRIASDRLLPFPAYQEGEDEE